MNLEDIKKAIYGKKPIKEVDITKIYCGMKVFATCYTVNDKYYTFEANILNPGEYESNIIKGEVVYISKNKNQYVIDFYDAPKGVTTIYEHSSANGIYLDIG